MTTKQFIKRLKELDPDGNTELTFNSIKNKNIRNENILEIVSYTMAKKKTTINLVEIADGK